MPNYEKDLKDVANKLGYANEKELLKELYAQYTLSEMEKIIGVTGPTLSRKLRALGVKMRKQGGNQRQGKRVLADVSDDIIYKTDAEEVAKTFGVRITTVYAERRIRKLAWRHSSMLA